MEELKIKENCKLIVEIDKNDTELCKFLVNTGWKFINFGGISKSATLNETIDYTTLLFGLRKENYLTN